MYLAHRLAHAKYPIAISYQNLIVTLAITFIFTQVRSCLQPPFSACGPACWLGLGFFQFSSRFNGFLSPMTQYKCGSITRL